MALYKAAFVKSVNQVEIRELSIPIPGNDEVLLKINYCGLCGSDYLDAEAWAREWKRFGHEIVGTIIEIGSDVSDFSIGEKVTVKLSTQCGQCPACLKGFPRKCSQLIIANQGGFGEYLIVPDRKLLVKIPESIPVPMVTFAEPLSVILDGFHTANVQKNEALLVVGGGFLGKLAVMAGSAMGLDNVGILSRTDRGINEIVKQTGGEYFCWQVDKNNSNFRFPVDLSTVLHNTISRLIVVHTAPPHLISNYLVDLPFDSVVLNFGLSGEKEELNITVDAQNNIFKRIQIMSGFPVPALYFGEAVKILQNNVELFSKIELKLIGLEQFADTIISGIKTGGKCIVSPR